ncbi:hypothetical protein HY837_05120, partial [archaeon]|nr:hypothetical protein [archaeon]
EWLEKNKLERGDVVYVHEKNDDELIVSPSLNKESNKIKEITLDYHKKEFESLKRELTSAYINNYNTINIVGRKLDEQNQIIKDMLSSFVALEISEQSEQRIVVKDLLNLNEIDINKTIRRMDMIVRSMFKEVNSNENLQFKDDDVNKIYFLIFRLLKSALQDTRMAEKLKVRPDQALTYWYLAINIENLADCCTNIKNKVSGNIKKQVEELESQYCTVMNSFFSKDKETADKLARQRNEILSQINTLPAGVSENLKQILTHINNIARIVLDEE